MNKWPIGVFTSIDAGLGVHLDVAAELGVPTIQLHAPHRSTRTPAKAKEFLDKLKSLDIELTCVFGGFEGESYADIPTVEKTVGLVPKATRAERLAEMKEIADFAKELKCSVVGLHIGFVPHNAHKEAFQGTVEVAQDLLDHCAKNGQNVHLETGQESAEGLLTFILATKRDNLFVNFDPANMILYGTGQPLDALKKVGKYVKSVHCKDGTWSKDPGVTWGQEVPLGEGDVNIEAYLRTLDEIGYTGPLTIEREIPQDRERQKAEIGKAVLLLTDLKRKLGAA